MYVADGSVKKFDITLRGQIDRQKNTQDPIAGYLLVPKYQNADDAICKQAIASAIEARSNSDSVLKKDNYVICITTQSVSNSTGQPLKEKFSLLEDTNESYLNLKQDYTVYFWVRDAGGKGEIFVSETGKPLNLLHVQGQFTSVTETYRRGNDITLALNMSTEKLENVDKAEFGILFTTVAITALDANKLQELADKYNEEGSTPAGWKHLSGDDRIYISGGVAPIEVKAQVGNRGNPAAGKHYHVYPVVHQQGMVYVLPSGCTYKTKPQSDTVQSLQLPITEKIDNYDQATMSAYLGKSVRLDESSREACVINNTTEEKESVLDPIANKAFIRIVIDNLLDDEAAKEAYDLYKVND